MFKSIQWRIGLSYLVLIVVCMALLSAYLLNYVRDYYLSNLEPQMVAEAHLVADSAEKRMASGNSDELDPLTKKLASETNSRITIIRRDGVVLGDSVQDPALMENHSQRPEVIQALASKVGESSRYSATVKYDMFYVAVPINVDGEVAGVARVSLPLEEINKSLQTAALNVGLAISAAAILAILLAILVARATTRSIRDLTCMAQGLAEGHLDQKIRVGSQDEVGKLAETFNQMSERLKETIETVSREHNRIAAILSSMADGIIIADSEGIVTLLNKAAERMLRLPQWDNAGRTIIEVVRDHELAQLVKECLSGTKPQEECVKLIEVGVPKRFLRAVVTPLWEGGAIHALVILQDLTELRRAEVVRREFVGNVSHELRTPLASIKALVETLRDGALEDPTAAQDFLNRMEIEVDGLTQLVRELLELSRIESGQVALKPERTDVLMLVTTATERLLAQAERAGIQLVTEIPPELPAVLADGERIQQVFSNLIHNAIKFTRAGGKVTISADTRDTAVCFSIADTGVGIPADDLPRIFERFYKADKSRSSGGTGLGLAIAKHIVQAHGGKIWAESIEGRGATFRFTLPLA